MAKNLNALRTVLMDVLAEGAVVINRKKLLLYFGRSQERPSVWSELLDEWVEIGQARDSLNGLVVADKIVLTLSVEKQGAHTNIENWANKT